MKLGNSASCRSVYQREIKLFVIGIEFHEKFENFALYIRNTLVGTVNFIDNNNGL